MTHACLHPFPLFHNLWMVIHKQQGYARGKSVKMAVLIQWRIRAVVFNQSSQWQSLWCSRGECDDDDDDSCWRGKHWKYTCTLICSLWSWAYSAMSVLRAALWEKDVVDRKKRGFESCGGTWDYVHMLLALTELQDTARLYCYEAVKLDIVLVFICCTCKILIKLQCCLSTLSIFFCL